MTQLNAATRLVATNDHDNMAKALIEHNYKLPLFELNVEGKTGMIYAKQSTSQIRTGNVNIMIKMAGEKEARIGVFNDSARNTVADLKEYIKDELIDPSSIKREL